MPPHANTTNGGIGFLSPRVFSMGSQQLKSFSTDSTTLRSDFSVLSKNISSVSLHGSAPLNCTGPAFFASLDASRPHLADLLITTSFGLNWNSMVPSGSPGLLPSLVGWGSYSFNEAELCEPPEVTIPLLDCSLGGPELVRAMAFDMVGQLS